MIRIKDITFNENKILYIAESDDDELHIMFENGYDIYVEATFDDIEWNYQEIDNIKRVMKAKEDAYQRIKELEEENKKLKEEHKELVETNYDLAMKKTKLEEENKKLKSTMKYTYDITV